MQRHRHNVKVSKLLVGLRPYQAYTKRHTMLLRADCKLCHLVGARCTAVGWCESVQIFTIPVRVVQIWC